MKGLDFIFLIVTTIAAIISFIFSEMLISSLYYNMSDILVVGIYFALVGIIIAIFTNVCAYKISSIKKIIPVPNAFLKSLAIFSTLAIVILFSVGCLFQYIYSLGLKNTQRIDNYIVVIDNSGSMAETDINYKRYEALNQLFTTIDKDQTISVYVFSDNYTKVLESKHISPLDIQEFQNTFAPHMVSDGGTETMKVLEVIAEEIKVNPLQGKTSVIVISDGECDVYDDVLEKFNLLSVPINTIGVYEEGFTDTLYQISNFTGGTYHNINNIEDLVVVLKGMNSFKIDHMLIGLRSNNVENPTYYLLLRILFLFLLSFIIKIMQLLIIDVSAVRKTIFFECILFSIIAGLLTEYLLQNTTITEPTIHMIMIFFISILIIPKASFGINPNEFNNSYKEYDDNTLKKQNTNNKKLLK